MARPALNPSDWDDTERRYNEAYRIVQRGNTIPDVDAAVTQRTGLPQSELDNLKEVGRRNFEKDNEILERMERNFNRGNLLRGTQPRRRGRSRKNDAGQTAKVNITIK